MIIGCPSCETRFALDPAKLGPTGRRVKCARCGHVWMQLPPDEEQAPTAAAARPAPAGPASDDSASARLKAEAKAPPSGRNLPMMPRRPRVRPRTAMLATAGLLALAILAGLVVARDDVAAAFPATAGVYDALGLSVSPDPAAVEPPGAYLELTDLESGFAESGGGEVLWVRGALTNPTDRERPVPRLRVTLLGENRSRLESWSFAPDAESLAPGERVAFETVRPDPDPAFALIEVTVDAGVP